MPTDWGSLFSEIKVDWIDRGRNIPPGNVGIKCPWCGLDDPSHHMAVSLEKDAYRCARSPNRHSGYSPIRLLVQLGLKRPDAIAVLNEHKHDGPELVHKRVTRPPGQLAISWSRFLPAAERQECIDYLGSRGFTDPQLTCLRYDLRYAIGGPYARRLLFPIKHRDEVYAWTGRAMRPGYEPRYLYPKDVDQYLIYVPRPPEETTIIVEGPIDALKVAVATEHLRISSVALTGLALSPPKLNRLRDMLSPSREFLLALDSTVNRNDIANMIDRLSEVLHAYKGRNQGLDSDSGRYIIRLPMHPGFDDPGETPLDIIPGWIQNARQRLGDTRNATQASFHRPEARL